MSSALTELPSYHQVSSWLLAHFSTMDLAGEEIAITLPPGPAFAASVHTTSVLEDLIRDFALYEPHLRVSDACTLRLDAPHSRCSSFASTSSTGLCRPTPPIRGFWTVWPPSPSFCSQGTTALGASSSRMPLEKQSRTYRRVRARVSATNTAVHVRSRIADMTFALAGRDILLLLLAAVPPIILSVALPADFAFAACRSLGYSGVVREALLTDTPA